MKKKTQQLTTYILIGLGLGICVVPFTFWFGWWISNYFFPDVKDTTNSPIEINLATTKISEVEGDIYGELIMICTGSGNAIFVQPDGKYFDAPNYCGTWSPDGRYMVKSDLDVVSGPDILLRERGSQDLINITENLPVPSWISYFSWSPDGKFLSIAGWDCCDETMNGIYLINMNGSSPQKTEFLYKTSEKHGLGDLTWSPNGKYIGISAGSSVGSPYILSMDGTIVWEAPDDLYPVGFPISWSPDSTQFVYTTFTEETTSINYDTQLVIVDIRTKKIHPVNLPMKAFWPHWSADGEWIIFRMGDGQAYVYASRPNGKDLTKLGESGRSWTIGGDTPDGKYFLLAEDIFSLNIDEKKPDPYTDSIKYYIVSLNGFKKEMFFQNDSFWHDPLALTWLPAIK